MNLVKTPSLQKLPVLDAVSLYCKRMWSHPAWSAVGVQWAFSAPAVGHCTCTTCHLHCPLQMACSAYTVPRCRCTKCPLWVKRVCTAHTVGTLYCFTVGLQCTLQRTVRPLHFELGILLVLHSHTITSKEFSTLRKPTVPGIMVFVMHIHLNFCFCFSFMFCFCFIKEFSFLSSTCPPLFYFFLGKGLRFFFSVSSVPPMSPKWTFVAKVTSKSCVTGNYCNVQTAIWHVRWSEGMVSFGSQLMYNQIKLPVVLYKISLFHRK